MHIIEDDLTGNEIRELLEIHFAGMLSYSPRGACHFLDIEALKGPTVTFWSARDNQAVAGCGALKELDPHHGEIKSMRTHPNFLRQGVASLLLDHIIMTAKSRGV
jgi:putative acetyltransferase